MVIMEKKTKKPDKIQLSSDILNLLMMVSMVSTLLLRYNDFIHWQIPYYTIPLWPNITVLN